MAYLTDRALASGVTLSDLLHIVIPSDVSQNPDGSSYKATIQQVGDALSGSSFNTYVFSGNADVATSTLTFLNNSGGTFTVTNSAALFSDNDINVTGGTYNPSNGCVTFTTNSGTTFNVCGFLTGFTDTFVTGGTYNSSTGDITFTNNSGGTFVVTDVLFTGNTSASCITDLYISNLYGCSPIVVHDTIETVTGIIRTSGGTGAELNLLDQFGPNGTWSITSDNGNYSAGSNWVYGQPNNGTQIAYQIDTYPGEAIGIGIFDNVSDVLYTGKEIVINNNKTSSTSTGSSDRRSIFIGSKSSTINSGVVNSVVIGGSNIVANDSNKVYVSSLNIDNILSGTSLINLGLDINGNVVTGTTGGGTFTGNTSGDCITDLFVSNIHSCSPLNINPSDEGNVYFGSTSGVTIDLVNNRVGINNENPQFTLDVAGETRLSGSGQNILTVIGSGDTQPLFTVQGSSGELFTITDSLVGSLFSVNDISGSPILEVFDDDTIHMGNYQAPSLNTTVLLNPGTGLSDVYSIPVSAYTGAFFDYTVLNSTGARAGNIMSIFSGSTVEFSETTTNDIGSTSDVTFTMSNDGSNATLQVSATTTGWEVKTIVRSI
jgi:hypothetical protein